MSAVTLEQAVRELRSATPGGVARTLRAAGVRGHRNLVFSCPVAIYVSRRTDDELVGAGLYRVWTTHPYTAARTPWAVRRFIHRFDKGKYPDLEER